MAWDTSVVTDAGVELLAAAVAGQKLVISSAAGGTGLTEESEMKSMTRLHDRRQTLTLTGSEKVTGGIRIRWQIKNETVTTGYQLQQVGIYGKIHGSETETLLLVLQDEAGIAIPAVSTVQEFLAEMYAVLGIANDADITVQVDQATVVSAAEFAVLKAEVTALHDTATQEADGLMSAADKAALDEVPRAYLKKANVVNNLGTTAAGYALDARQGKKLRDLMLVGVEITESTINSSLYTEPGNYYFGSAKTGVPSGVTNGRLFVRAIPNSEDIVSSGYYGIRMLIDQSGNVFIQYFSEPAVSGMAPTFYDWVKVATQNEIDEINSKFTEVLDKNWLNMNCVRNGNGLKFIRCSNYPNAAMSAGTTYNVGTLSEKFRPTYAISQAFMVNAASNIIGILNITTAGAVTFQPLSGISTATGININLAFI